MRLADDITSCRRAILAQMLLMQTEAEQTSGMNTSHLKSTMQHFYSTLIRPLKRCTLEENGSFFYNTEEHTVHFMI